MNTRHEPGSPRRWRTLLLALALGVLVGTPYCAGRLQRRVKQMVGPTFREKYLAPDPTGSPNPLKWLMFPPATSLEAFEQLRRGNSVEQHSTPDHPVFVYSPGAELIVARSLAMLAKPFWMPEDVACLGFRNETDGIDVLRCHWRAGPWQLQYAESSVMWSLRVRGPGLEVRSMDTVRRAAENIFVPVDGVPALGIAFKLLGDDGKVVFGRHDRSVREGILLNSRDRITWYHDGKAVGFFAPTDAAPGMPMLADNDPKRKWIGPYFDEFFLPQMLEIMFPSDDVLKAWDELDAGHVHDGFLEVRGDDRRVHNFPLLADAYRVPPDHPCLVVGASKIDPVGYCRYEVWGRRLWQASSHGVRVVMLENVEIGEVPPEKAEFERAEIASYILFGMRLKLQVLGRYRGMTFGKRKALPAGALGPTAFRWWTDGAGSAGFVVWTGVDATP